LQEPLTSNSLEKNFFYENSFQQNTFDKRSSNGNYTPDKILYSDVDHSTYAPTFENLINGSSSSINYDALNEQLIGRESMKYLLGLKFYHFYLFIY
jgi:hypothetical protein